MSQDLVIQKQYGTHRQEPSEGCICHKQQNDNLFTKTAKGGQRKHINPVKFKKKDRPQGS